MLVIFSKEKYISVVQFTLHIKKQGRIVHGSGLKNEEKKNKQKKGNVELWSYLTLYGQKIISQKL